MMKHFSTLISGILALLIYLTVVGVLLFYFNTRSEERSRHYVKKDEKRIRVALSESSKKALKKSSRSKGSKPALPERTREKRREKHHLKKHLIKEKSVKKKRSKKRDHNRTRPKKKAKDLFKNIKTVKKKKLKIQITDKPVKPHVKNNLIKVSSMSASERIRAAEASRKQYSSGVENAYFAKVQQMLEAWPAQSDYAGEKAKVVLSIRPSGFFTFKVVSYSNIPEFNRGLESFLEQLQLNGFGPHNGRKTYQFEAEFIAKE